MGNLSSYIASDAKLGMAAGNQFIDKTQAEWVVDGIRVNDALDGVGVHGCPLGWKPAPQPVRRFYQKT
jgi:hypothetical protein